MALSIFITITILLLHSFFFLKKELSFLQNSILFFILAIATKNYSTIMTMGLKRLKTPDEHTLFGVFLLHREIITPLIVMLFVNIFISKACWWKRILLLLSALVLMQGLDYLSIFFEVIKFLKWNHLYAAVINLAYLLIGLGVGKLLMYLEGRYAYDSV